MARMTNSQATTLRDKGLGHWRWQRASALATFGVMVYFAYMVARIGQMDYADASAFVAVPLHALGLVVLLVAGLFHAALGVQMIIEDYIHGANNLKTALILNNIVVLIVIIGSIYSVLTI